MHAFLGLEEEWNELLLRAGHDVPFLRHEWFRLWWEHFGGDDRMTVILVRCEGRLQLALPLVERERNVLGLRYRVLDSMTNLHSYHWGIVAVAPEGDAIEALLSHLRCRPERWDVMRLQHLSPEESAESVFIRGAETRRLCTGLWTAPGMPYLPIEGSWESYIATLSRKFRKTLRHRARHLRRLGSPEFEVYTDESDVSKMLPIGLEVEKRSWKGRVGSAIACDPVLTSFYTRIAEMAARKGWLRITLLRVGDRYAAFDFSLKYDNRWFCLKLGCDPEFAQCSVGHLMAEHILKRCHEERVVDCNLMALREWRPRLRRQTWLYVYNRGPIPWISYAWKFPMRTTVKGLLNAWTIHTQS